MMFVIFTDANWINFPPVGREDTCKPAQSSDITALFVPVIHCRRD